MNELKHDPELPYAVVDVDTVIARFARKEDYLDWYGGTNLRVALVDTTPKPKIPEDADYIIWELDGETLMASRDGGEWFGNGEYWTEEQMAEEVENAEVTVLVRKEDQ